MSSDDSLLRTAQFIVQELRQSKLPLQARTEILLSTRYGRLLSRLHPLGLFGGLLFVIGAVIKPPATTQFRRVVCEDHASKVIHNSFRRVYGPEYIDEVSSKRPSRSAVLFTFIRMLSRLCQAYKASDIQHFSEYARLFNLFYFSVSWSALLTQIQPQALFIARTNDPKRLALGAAAEGKVDVGTFIVDQVALRKPAPFAVRYTFCRTASQKQAAEEHGITAVQMPVSVRRDIKLPVPLPGKGTCGILLNAKCDPAKLGEWIDGFAARFPDVTFHIRPHPGYETAKLSHLKNSTISDWNQGLADYLDELDVAFALNTNAIIEALLHGVPVVYLGGLDPYKYDLHRFVDDGIACPYSADDAFPEAVTAFYDAKEFRDRWNPEEFTTDGSAERDTLLSIIEQ